MLTIKLHNLCQTIYCLNHYWVFQIQNILLLLTFVKIVENQNFSTCANQSIVSTIYWVINTKYFIIIYFVKIVENQTSQLVQCYLLCQPLLGFSNTKYFILINICQNCWKSNFPTCAKLFIDSTIYWVIITIYYYYYYYYYYYLSKLLTIKLPNLWRSYLLGYYNKYTNTKCTLLHSYFCQMLKNSENFKTWALTKLQMPIFFWQ